MNISAIASKFNYYFFKLLFFVVVVVENYYSKIENKV